MMMSVWVVHPRDPLIFRDGRPFNATPGAQAQSLPFPYPSTLAGAVRTRSGRNAAGWFDPGQDLTPLLQMRIRGPLLVALDESEDVAAWYFPAPADCLVVEAEREATGYRHWVRPVSLPEGAFTNVKELGGLRFLVSTYPRVEQKAHKQAPRFWNWETLQAWLERPADDAAPVSLPALGIRGLSNDSRVHVCIDPETGTASPALLFETCELEFQREPQREAARRLSDVRRYGLAVETDADLEAGIDFLGGERRIVRWAPSNQPFPNCPPAIRDMIVEGGHCRLLLATPAIFEQGHLPQWICEKALGVEVNVVAAAVPRYQGISGWDVKDKQEKPSRRLAPAGSVYYLSLEGARPAIEEFVDSVWMNTISDDEQDRREGFGLALLGVWDGEIKPLEVQA